MNTACDAGRRAFLKALTVTAASLAAGCEVSGSPRAYRSATGSPPAPVVPPPVVPPVGNQAPVWSTVPTITFTQGVAGSISIAGFVSDANGDTLAISKNAAALPAGVTYDAANKRFVYDGSGPVASTSGHVLTADDGQP